MTNDQATPRSADPQEIIDRFLTPMSSLDPQAEHICEMRRCLVEDARLCGYAEAQNLPLADLFLFYVQYQREREASR